MEDPCIRKCWSVEEVKAFLSCFIARRDEFLPSRKKLYGYSNILQELLEKKSIAPDTTVPNLENKMKSLIKVHRIAKKRNVKNEFTAEMDEIFRFLNISLVTFKEKFKNVDSSVKEIKQPKISTISQNLIPPPSTSYSTVIDPCGYCRICCVHFDTNMQKHSLFIENDENNLTNIGEMFVEYLFKELEPNNGFFDHLCSECTTKLIDFHQFRCQAFDASKKINDLRENDNHKDDPLLSTVKIEDNLTEINSEQHEISNNSMDNSFSFVKVEDTPVQVDCSEPTSDKDHTSVLKGFKCNLCNKHFEFYRDFTNHNQKVHSQCEICHKQLIGPANLKIHMDSHRDRELKCRYCGDIYFTFSTLSRHEARHRPGPKRRRRPIEKPFECHICHNKFQGPTNLKLHIANVHLELMCRFCGEKLFSADAMKRHEARHTNEFVCSICDKRFPTEHSLRIHHQGHANHRRYICEICGSKFRNKSHITCHLESHGSARLKCEFCDKTFKRTISQRIHREKYHLRRNLMICSLCENVVHFLKRHAHVLYHKKKGEDVVMRRVPDNYTRPKNV